MVEDLASLSAWLKVVGLDMQLEAGSAEGWGAMKAGEWVKKSAAMWVAVWAAASASESAKVLAAAWAVG